MRRRDLLAAAGVAALAGCPSGTPDSRFEDEPCPSIGADRTCYHTVTDRGSALVLEPDTEFLDEPGPNRFTLHNRTGERVAVRLPFPYFARRFDGRWQHVPNPRQDDLETAPVEPGGSLRVGLVEGGWRELSDIDYTLEGASFGAGEFVFGVSVRDASFNRMAALARFDVGGSPLQVNPPTGRQTEVDDGTITVFPERENGPIPGSTVAFTKETDASDPIALAPEVVTSRADIRALTFLRRDDIDTVVVGLYDEFFQSPIEWLQAAGVWEGPDRVYGFEGLSFTISETVDAPSATSD